MRIDYLTPVSAGNWEDALQLLPGILLRRLEYCLYVLMQKRLAALAPGLTVRQALDRLSNVQMIDIQFPTTDGRILKMSRYTQPDKGTQLMLTQLKMSLPQQPPPRIRGNNELEM